jgi:hypothetical protein
MKRKEKRTSQNGEVILKLSLSKFNVIDHLAANLIVERFTNPLAGKVQLMDQGWRIQFHEQNTFVNIQAKGMIGNHFAHNILP